MARIAVIIKSEPYSDESVFTGLKFVLTALADSHEVDVFLVQSGVFCAIMNQSPDKMPNHYEMLDKVLKEGGCVVCCGTCTKARGLRPEMLHPKAKIGSMGMFVEMVTTADSVINF